MGLGFRLGEGLEFRRVQVLDFPDLLLGPLKPLFAGEGGSFHWLLFMSPEMVVMFFGAKVKHGAQTWADF